MNIEEIRERDKFYQAAGTPASARGDDIERVTMCGRDRHELLAHVAALEARCRELEAALRGLHHECCEAGHNTDKDYKWPIVMKAAASALETQGDAGGIAKES